MKRFLLVSVLLSALLLLLTPAIPAIEFQSVKTNMDSMIEEHQNNFSMMTENIQSLFEKMVGESQFPSTFEFLSTNSNTMILSLIESFTSTETEPYIDSLLDLIVVIIVAYVLSKILSHVFDQVFIFFKNTGSTIFTIITTIMNFLFQVLVFGVDSVILIIQLLFQFLLKVGELGIYLIMGILSLILTIIVIIVYALGIGVLAIWKVFGGIFGMILDILRVIYESIFPNTLEAIIP